MLLNSVADSDVFILAVNSVPVFELKVVQLTDFDSISNPVPFGSMAFEKSFIAYDDNHTQVSVDFSVSHNVYLCIVPILALPVQSDLISFHVFI